VLGSQQIVCRIRQRVCALHQFQDVCLTLGHIDPPRGGQLPTSLRDS
jgi:hypothetical protein